MQDIMNEALNMLVEKIAKELPSHLTHSEIMDLVFANSSDMELSAFIDGYLAGKGHGLNQNSLTFIKSLRK